MISKVIQQILVRGSGVYIWQQEENQSGKVSMDGKCNIYPISDKVERPQAKVKMESKWLEDPWATNPCLG